MYGTAVELSGIWALGMVVWLGERSGLLRGLAVLVVEGVDGAGPGAVVDVDIAASSTCRLAEDVMAWRSPQDVRPWRFSKSFSKRCCSGSFFTS